MYYISNLQPRRPLEGLNYRTYPRTDDPGLAILRDQAVTAQMMMYRWFANNEVPEMVSIDDLHREIFNGNHVSKRVMGQMLLNALSYDPRKTKGVEKGLTEKATACYVIKDSMEVVYGLEWMICSWYRKFFGPYIEDEIKDADDMAREFEIIKTCDPREFSEMIADLNKVVIQVKPIDWKKLWVTLGFWPSEIEAKKRAAKYRPALGQPKKLKNLAK